MSDFNTLEHMEAAYVPIDSVLPNEYNPNRQSDREFELLCRSIEEDGFTQPILVQKPDADYQPNHIVDGEHRWRACKALGWKEMPVVYVNFTEAQMKISTLRHNRARGNEDIARTASVLRDLQQLNALDHAADSLLLDDVEIDVMLRDIPQAELILRAPEEKLTFEEVEASIQQERDHETKKAQDDLNTAAKEGAKIKFALRMHAYEKWQIMQVAKQLTGSETNFNATAITLCELYQDDPDAIAFMDKEDDQPLYTEEIEQYLKGASA